MVWYLGIWPSGFLFRWQDKSGSNIDKDTPLPFSKWAASPKVTDISNIPTIAKVEYGKGSTLPDALEIGQTIVVSGRFKAIVEDVEPDVHQFFPVTLLHSDETPYDGEYFIFHPTQYVPCVLLSKSGIQSRVVVEHGKRIGLIHYTVRPDQYVISRTDYGNRKIFGSLFVMNDGLLVSDGVIDRIKAEKIEIFITHPVKELDEPWIFEKEAPDLVAFLKEHPDIAAITPYQLTAF